MTDPIFDHDRLDVYRLFIEYVSSAFDVSMLTRMAKKFDGVGESSVDYSLAIDYEHEHREARKRARTKPCTSGLLARFYKWKVNRPSQVTADISSI